MKEQKKKSHKISRKQFEKIVIRDIAIYISSMLILTFVNLLGDPDNIWITWLAAVWALIIVLKAINKWYNIDKDTL